MKIEDVVHGDEPLTQALSHLHYGLYFLSTGELSRPQGMLVSWVSQVGGKPPLILSAVRENRSIHPGLEKKSAFCLNLLPARDKELLGRLARPAGARFEGIELEKGASDVPFLSKAVGALCCRVLEVWRPGDHLLYLGQVESAVWRGAGPAMSAAEVGHAYLGLS
ncbi:MAG: flavin reductase family protein [Desulfarculaceae bacterium]|jgi:flavin reductase (DIM6/NTAB) family NADH-FMN oxidoreductase RutF